MVSYSILYDDALSIFGTHILFVVYTLPFVIKIDDLKHYDGDNGKLYIDKHDFNLYSCLHVSIAKIKNNIFLTFVFMLLVPSLPDFEDIELCKLSK